MRGKVLRKLSGGILVALLALGLLVAVAVPASSHTVVRRYYGHHHYRYPARVGYVSYAPAPVVVRHYPYHPYGCRLINGYYYDPHYGRHLHSHVGFGVHVVF